jgi:hypothetical protein
MAYETWQLDNLEFDAKHFGKAYPAEPRTPALWKRWPETWRVPNRPSPLGLVCSDPLPLGAVVTSFEPLSGRALTRDEFVVWTGVAYGFALHHRWRGLPANPREAFDFKSAALAEAYNKIVADFADGISPRPFPNFNDFLVWFRTTARNRVKTVRTQSLRQEEQQPHHIRRRRLGGTIECPWCWSAVEEHAVPRATRICPRCGVGLPAGVWVNYTETVCRRYANNPKIGPGVPSSVQLNERRLNQRPTDPVTAPVQGETKRLRRSSGLADGTITAGVVLEEVEVPSYAESRTLRAIDSWLSSPRNGFGRCRSYEPVKRDLRDDSAHIPVRLGKYDGVASSHHVRWTGTRLAPEEHGCTAPPARVRRQKDGARQVIDRGIPDPDSVPTPEEVIARIKRKLSRAERWLEKRWAQICRMEDELLAEVGPDYQMQRARPVRPKGSTVRKAWLLERREAKKVGHRLLEGSGSPATDKDWRAAAVQDAINDYAQELVPAVEELRQRLTEQRLEHKIHSLDRNNESLQKAEKIEAS